MDQHNDRKGSGMKGLFIITETNEMHKHFESFTSLKGNEVSLYKYTHRRSRADVKGSDLDTEIVARAAEYKPDIIVYIGACAGNIPSPEVFAHLRQTEAPTVHFCSDAADEPWWNLLREYDQKKSFSCQVALDGNHHWPLASTEITALTPIPLRYFPTPPIPHYKRQRGFGFAGNIGRNGNRRPIVDAMMSFGLEIRQRSPNGDAESYIEAAQFMAQSRIIPNMAQTGSFTKLHVKGRVIEAGLSASLLLEMKGAPTAVWFEPGVDYLEYSSIDELRAIVKRFEHRHSESEQFGKRLRARVLNDHAPMAFWNRIFRRVGLPEATEYAA